MMRSLYSGISGLRVHQTRMDVIGNNVANVNTIGFKSSRVTFAEVFAQTLAKATAANEELGIGSKNPMQIGLGARVASIDRLFKQGAGQQTDFPYDLMIQGESFFIIGDGMRQFFTRAGAFNFDVSGRFVNADGMNVMGWQRTRDENGDFIVDAGTVVSPIVITDEMRRSEPRTTTDIKFAGNLNAFEDVYEAKMTFYDSLGYRYVTDVTFTYDRDASGGGANLWTFAVHPQMYWEGDPDTKIELNGDLSGTIIFDQDGNLVGPQNFNLFVLEGGRLPDSYFGDDERKITIDLTTLTQYGESPSDAECEMINGHPLGYLQDVAVGADGVITGRYSNGQVDVLAQIAVTRFDNPQGLESYGSNLFYQTANSGQFNGIGEGVMDSGGVIMSGMLEMSNVDLAGEFTNMIVTQRGFQANSRIISVSDDMLQELVNLKR